MLARDRLSRDGTKAVSVEDVWIEETAADVIVYSAQHVPWREAHIDHPTRVGLRQQRHGTDSCQQRTRYVTNVASP